MKGMCNSRGSLLSQATASGSHPGLVPDPRPLGGSPRYLPAVPWRIEGQVGAHDRTPGDKKLLFIDMNIRETGLGVKENETTGYCCDPNMELKN